MSGLLNSIVLVQQLLYSLCLGIEKVFQRFVFIFQNPILLYNLLINSFYMIKSLFQLFYCQLLCSFLSQVWLFKLLSFLLLLFTLAFGQVTFSVSLDGRRWFLHCKYRFKCLAILCSCQCGSITVKLSSIIMWLNFNLFTHFLKLNSTYN